LTGIVVLFQLALAAGAPWGHLAMGGKYPGRFPARIRFLSVFNAVILMALGGVVAARAGIYLQALRDLSAWAIWIVVVFGALSMVANLATSSTPERALWGPVSIVMVICALIVALGPMSPLE
jgi:hypothetical protein